MSLDVVGFRFALWIRREQCLRELRVDVSCNARTLRDRTPPRLQPSDSTFTNSTESLLPTQAPRQRRKGSVSAAVKWQELRRRGHASFGVFFTNLRGDVWSADGFEKDWVGEARSRREEEERRRERREQGNRRRMNKLEGRVN